MINRVTPEDMTGLLGRDTMFVFGSNESGIHGAGAARFAFDYCGAQLGMGFGPMANSFAIPTKAWGIESMSLNEVEFYIKRFIVWAKSPVAARWKIYVTRIGCGLAGFTPQQIAPLFRDLRHQYNVWLPQEFINIIDGVSNSTTTTTLFPINLSEELPHHF